MDDAETGERGGGRGQKGEGRRRGGEIGYKGWKGRGRKEDMEKVLNDECKQPLLSPYLPSPVCRINPLTVFLVTASRRHCPHI